MPHSCTHVLAPPFPPAKLRDLADAFGTPLWVYDATTIVRSIERLRMFERVRFAQKACSNTHILRLMREAGVWVDAVSAGEVLRALAAGYVPVNDVDSPVVFTADVLDAQALHTVTAHGVPVNAGSIDMLAQLGAASPGHCVWLRINPGFGHGHSNKTNTGGEHSKHGIWHTELEAALDAVQRYGLRLAGLHMHIGSGVDYDHLAQVCDAMVALVQRVKDAGADLHAISAGGGLSIPYQSGDTPVDTAHYHALWQAARQQAQRILGHALELELEPGRFLMAEAGVLLGSVCAVKDMGANRFILADVGFNELMRPAMYGSYHGMHIQRGAQVLPAARPAVVAGPLCESGDVFTQGEGGIVLPRMMGQAQVGDLLVIHHTGAYGSSMSSNYNSRPLAAEVLVGMDGQPRLIRRRQSVQDLLALEMGL